MDIEVGFSEVGFYYCEEAGGAERESCGF